MTTIQTLPEELLLVIFDNLYDQELIKCQYVCRTWYIPARVKFLNQRVILMNTSRIRRFITAINRNPNPRFLAAVKQIDLWDTKNWNVTDTVLHRLLFRFPNLEIVNINATLLSSLSDDRCRLFLKHCSHLEQLRVVDFTYLTARELCKARLVLTDLNLRFERVDNIEQFVQNFVRLRVLNIVTRFATFEKLLPLLVNLPNLTTIEFQEIGKDANQFLEKYLQTKTPEERHQLLERLSKITNLSIDCATLISKDALEFIVKYMAGLEYIKMDKFILENIQQSQLYSACVSLIQSIKHCRLYMTITPSDAQWDCLPSFVQQAFQRPADKRILDLYVHDEIQPRIDVNAKEDTRLSISLSDHHLYNIPALFNNDTEMEKFELKILSREKAYMNTYDAFFKAKSTAKQVTFQVPETILGGETPIDEEIAENHTSVTELTIESPGFATVEPILERCAIAFPNLKLLTLERFFGRWKEELSKYQLDLGKYNLETLVMYLLPLYREDKEPWIVVIEVEVLSSGDKYLYKIPSDNSEPTRIDEQDDIGVVCGEDYILIHLIVGSLRNLKILSRFVTKTSRLFGLTCHTKLDVELVPTTSANSK